VLVDDLLDQLQVLVDPRGACVTMLKCVAPLLDGAGSRQLVESERLTSSVTLASLGRSFETFGPGSSTR
jgi:hypothetical protein